MPGASAMAVPASPRSRARWNERSGRAAVPGLSSAPAGETMISPVAAGAGAGAGAGRAAAMPRAAASASAHSASPGTLDADGGLIVA